MTQQTGTTDGTRLREVEFSSLVAPDEINAREGGSSRQSIQELAAAIVAKGLINPLVVRPADGGKFEVADGRRRFKAMQLLVRDKKMKRKDLVPVIVRNEDDAEALETSLMANTAREPMHPVDQHAVFARLIDRGRTPADIAATYALDERTVRQHLALGKLAPAIRDAWRKGQLDAEAAQAFTIHPSHDVQSAAFERIKKSRQGFSRHTVRRELASDKVPAGNLPAAVLEAYVAAGGTITESLFDDERFLDDGALLKKLQADAKAQRVEEARAWLSGHGWGWVAEDSELPIEWRWQWDRLQHASSLEGERLREIQSLEEQAARAETEAEADELDAKAERIRLEAELESYTPEMRARAGAVICVRWDDHVDIELGLLKPSADGTIDIESAIDTSRPASPAGGDDSTEHAAQQAEAEDATEPAGAVIPNALLRDITAVQTDAARTALANDDGHLVLCVAVAALEAQSYASPAKLQITHEATSHRVRNADFAAVLSHLVRLPMSDVITHFTALVAESLNLEAVSNQAPRPAAKALVHALDGTIYLSEMRARFAVDDYFKRAPREVILDALGEMEEAGVTGSIPDTAIDWKKRELSDFAARHASACGWLPVELRHPAYAIEPAAKRLTGKDAAAEQSSEVAA